MKPTGIFASMALLGGLCFSVSALAQRTPPANAVLDIDTAISNPADAAGLRDRADLWIAYQVPAVDGLTSPCCWSGSLSDLDRGLIGVGCTLGQHENNFGTVTDRGLKTFSVIVYARWQQGRVTDLQGVGQHCPVDAQGQRVVWLEQVEENASIAWLTRLMHQGDGANSVADHAGMALAWHRSEKATEALYDTARESPEATAGNAVFWLGQRGDAALPALIKLLDELEPGDIREAINFALGENGSEQAVETLVRLSRDDRDDEQRGGALFWLAQTGAAAALPRLDDAARTDPSEDVRDQALHGLAELETDAAADVLLGIAKDHSSTETRSQALFWLAQSYPKQAAGHLARVFRDEKNQDVLEQAIFVASELPDGQGSAMLLALVKGDYSREVKRHALFWLAQSDDETALDELQALLLNDAR